MVIILTQASEKGQSRNRSELSLMRLFSISFVLYSYLEPAQNLTICVSTKSRTVRLRPKLLLRSLFHIFRLSLRHSLLPVQLRHIHLKIQMPLLHAGSRI